MDNIINVEGYANRTSWSPYGVMGVDWSAEVGFGRWEMYFDAKGIPHILSEGMDSEHDKSFSKKILMALLDVAVVEE